MILLLCLSEREIGIAQQRMIEVDFEVITNTAVSGDGGNNWGPHICRIVRTDDGVYTTFTSGDNDFLQRRWHLMKRTNKGWKEIAQGKSGREPVNLLVSPDGELLLIAYPDLQATLFSGKPKGDTMTLTSQPIPVMVRTTHPYNSSAIDANGNIYVLSSEGGEKGEKGVYRWALYHKKDQQWQGRISLFDFRYCYTFIFPQSDGSVILVSSRDVTWDALGYKKPPGIFNYVFDAYGLWYCENFNRFLERRVVVNEIPSQSFPFVLCFVRCDAFIDHKKNIHILNGRLGQSTNGAFENYHSIYRVDGTMVSETKLSPVVGETCRIFQDHIKRLFIIGDSGFIGRLSNEDYSIKESFMLDMQGYRVDYSGFFVPTPRSGSKTSRYMDVVFPANEGRSWIYFTLDLENLFGDPN